MAAPAPSTSTSEDDAYAAGAAGGPAPQRGQRSYGQRMAAYNRGRASAGLPPAPSSSTPAPSSSAPPAPSSSSTPAPSPPPAGAPASTPGWLSRPVGGGDGTGLLLGLVAYAVGLNFLRNGPQGVRDWCAAKFLNKTKS